MDELVRPIVEAAEHDPNVAGVLLKGSQAMGAADEESDWDVVVILLEGEQSQKKDGRLELITTTLERVRGVSLWDLPALAHSRVLLDKTGELAEAVAAAGHLTHSRPPHTAGVAEGGRADRDGARLPRRLRRVGGSAR